jgi:DNA-directed RNA polymerase subunit RPC12/RpoP
MAPLYSYLCRCGRENERVFKIARTPKSVKCERCGGKAKKAIVWGHGGHHSDTPGWLDDGVRMALQDLTIPGTVPIETRTAYKKFLKENPNIVPRC